MTPPTLPKYLDFINYSDRARRTLYNLMLFMNEYVYPAEQVQEPRPLLIN